MTLLVDTYVYLHTQNDASTAEIAELLHRKKNTVLTSLRNRGALRQSLGRAVEEEVAQWFERQGPRVVRQRGDASFDILVGTKRIDVKSASLSRNNPGSYAYSFQLQDRYNRLAAKNYEHSLDEFLLVFMDEVGRPMYSLKSSDVSVQTLTIHNISTSKYPLQLAGYLDGKGGGNI